MTDMGEIKWILGKNVVHMKEGIFINQTIFIQKIMDRFNLFARSRYKIDSFYKRSWLNKLLQYHNSENMFD